MSDTIFTPYEREQKERRRIGQEFAKGNLVAYVQTRTYPVIFPVKSTKTMHHIDFRPADQHPAADAPVPVHAAYIEQLQDIVANGSCSNATIVKDILKAAALPKPS